MHHTIYFVNFSVIIIAQFYTVFKAACNTTVTCWNYEACQYTMSIDIKFNGSKQKDKITFSKMRGYFRCLCCCYRYWRYLDVRPEGRHLPWSFLVEPWTVLLGCQRYNLRPWLQPGKNNLLIFISFCFLEFMQLIKGDGLSYCGADLQINFSLITLYKCERW